MMAGKSAHHSCISIRMQFEPSSAYVFAVAAFNRCFNRDFAAKLLLKGCARCIDLRAQALT